MKAIEKEKEKLQSELQDIKCRAREGSRRAEVIVKRIAAIVRELNTIPKQVEVTDHAIVQYLRRVMGIDIDELVKKILNKEARTPPGALGDGEYPCEEGHRSVVKDNKIVTIK